MRKLSVSTLVTLDGVVQDPGGFGETQDAGWANAYFDDEAGRLAYEHLLASDVFLLGRETYELFKEHWTRGPSDRPRRRQAGSMRSSRLAPITGGSSDTGLNEQLARG
jgi:dihydrofolate reductase